MAARSLPLRKEIKRAIAKRSMDYRINQTHGITQVSTSFASTRSGNVGYITTSTTERCRTVTGTVNGRGGAIETRQAEQELR